jgi:hypothetical protein
MMLVPRFDVIDPHGQPLALGLTEEDAKQHVEAQGGQQRLKIRPAAPPDPHRGRQPDDPSPEEIRAACREIRAGWSRLDLIRRSQQPGLLAGGDTARMGADATAPAESWITAPTANGSATTPQHS